MADLAQLASWLLGFSLLFGVALWLVALIKWVAGGDPLRGFKVLPSRGYRGAYHPEL